MTDETEEQVTPEEGARPEDTEQQQESQQEQGEQQEGPEAKPEGEEGAEGKEKQPEAKPEDKDRKQKNRTKAYIDRINRERAELAQQAEEYKAELQKLREHGNAPDKKPTLEDHNFDQDAYSEALVEWKAKQLLSQQTEQQQQAEQQKRQRETEATYNQRIAEFAEDHPDFPEVVGSIPYPMSNELQAAIMAHENGPEIAYHLGNDDDDAFNLAMVQPHLAAAAVDRLAKRLTAAPEAPQTPSDARPVSKAPPPTQTVSGKTPTPTPEEKLTDDEWFKRKHKKQAS